ncbi:MAG: hypothetical protein WC761_02995 [Candidatus Paceibacterota bacterium]|jgi:hypothetical protein
MKASVLHSNPTLVILNNAHGNLSNKTTRVSIESDRVGKIEIPCCRGLQKTPEAVNVLHVLKKGTLEIKGCLLDQWFRPGDKLKILAS